MKKPTKTKLLIITPVITGMILFSAGRSDASILDSLKSIWNSTTQSISSTFDRYIGHYMEVYIPKGLEAVAGALGLPDLAEIFKEMEQTTVLSEDDFIIYNLTEEGELAADTTSTMGEIIFSAPAQDAAKELGDASTQMAQQSLQLAQDCQAMNITQEIIKCLAFQNANEANLARVEIMQNQQILEQLAAANLANANVAKSLIREEKAKQAADDEAANQILQEAKYNNAILDSLGK